MIVVICNNRIVETLSDDMDFAALRIAGELNNIMRIPVTVSQFPTDGNVSGVEVKVLHVID